VRRKSLQLIGMWAQEWESDPTLGLMEECYKALRAKSMSVRTYVPHVRSQPRQTIHSTPPTSRLRPLSTMRFAGVKKRSSSARSRFP
jgi:hypothetical protein